MNLQNVYYDLLCWKPFLIEILSILTNHVGYSYKILLKNIEGGTKMMGTYKLSFSSFLLSIWLIMT